jgi:hypothetical protein
VEEEGKMAEDNKEEQEKEKDVMKRRRTSGI